MDTCANIFPNTQTKIISRDFFFFYISLMIFNLITLNVSAVIPFELH